MISHVASAIMTIYNSSSASSLRALNTGGMFFQQANQSASEPFIVFSWDGSDTEDEAGGRGDVIETANISFDIFSREDDGGREAYRIAESFMALYDWKDIPYSGASGFEHIANRRTSTGSLDWIDDVWNISLNYEIMFHH